MPNPTPEERTKTLDENWEISLTVKWPEEVLADIAESIRAAVAAETERCAKIADEKAGSWIAAAIRRGTEE